MKLLQWNIWYKEDISNILSVLKEINPDVICLQELTINHPHYNQDIDTPRFIAEGLGFHYFFKEAESTITNGKVEKYGNAIFSRYPIMQTHFHYIQDPSNPNAQETDYSKEGRVYIESKIEAEGKSYVVATTHMSYTDKFLSTPLKDIEIKKLIYILQEKKADFIFTGDLNALPNSALIEGISKQLKNAGPGFEEKTWTTKPFSYNGFDAATLDWRLDYCFATPDIQIKSAKVVDTPYSDHLPILIEC